MGVPCPCPAGPPEPRPPGLLVRQTWGVIWIRPPLHAGDFEEESAGPEVGWRPDLDIYESASGFLLLFDLPGVRTEDLEVSLIGRTLRVSGIRRVLVPAGAVAHLVEGPRGKFERRLRLPAIADVEHLSTELKDGRLAVLIGKRTRASVAVRVRVSRP